MKLGIAIDRLLLRNDEREICENIEMIEAIKRLVEIFGSKNTVLFVTGDQKLVAQIQKWLDGKHFYSRTGVQLDRVIATPHVPDVREHGLTHFAHSRKKLRKIAKICAARVQHRLPSLEIYRPRSEAVTQLLAAA